MSPEKIIKVKDIMQGQQPTKILSLDDSSKTLSLLVGERTELVPQVYLTLSPDNAGALIELEGEVSKDVMVDGLLVIDVAHMKNGQVLKIGDKTFTLLANMDVFVRQNTSLTKKVDYLSKQLVEIGQEKLFEQPISEVVVLNPKKLAAASQSERRSKIQKALGLFVVVAASISVGYWLNRPPVLQTPNGKVAEEAAAETEPGPSVEEGRNVAAPSAETAVVTSVPPVAPIAIPPAAPAIRKPLVKQLSKLELKKIQEKVSEIELEARFDPELAKKKLRELLKSLPKESELAKRIIRVIHAH